ncbi:hypothetical protein Gilli_3417 [Gillisia limnaea DSM 15749]|uniref:Uncharacterized protein n=1 Tax=Gillisia limnaea (strain DSM 15749 / LMG 21470 / R-8282) TaxID=865937 RepID=H2BVR1_GILLR|nr:hypothetical protein Gilli_3417 [Gillisia limnaea DSM 15749]
MFNHRLYDQQIYTFIIPISRDKSNALPLILGLNFILFYLIVYN